MKNHDFLASKLSHVVFIMLISVIMLIMLDFNIYEPDKFPAQRSMKNI